MQSLLNDFNTGVSNYNKQEQQYQNQLQAKLQAEQNQGFLGNLLQDITSPLRTIGEGARSFGALATGQPIDRNFNLNSLLSTQELQKAVENPEQVFAQQTAKAGSFLLPGVAGIGSIPGAVASGALQGFGNTEDLSNTGQTIQDIVAGGAIGGVTQGIFDKVVPLAGKGLSKLGGKLDDFASSREIAAVSKAVGGNPSKRLGGSELIKDISNIAASPEFKTVINNTDDVLALADNVFAEAGGVVDSRAAQLTQAGRQIETASITKPLKAELAKIKTEELRRPLQHVIDTIEQQGDFIDPTNLLQLRREFGKLGKFNPTVSTSDQQLASAFEKAYASSSDELRKAFKAAGFNDYDSINKLLETATKAEQWVRQKSGKAATSSITDLLQDSAFFGYAATGGNPLGAGGGVLLNKFLSAPAGERAVGSGANALSKLLSGVGDNVPNLPAGLSDYIGPGAAATMFAQSGVPQQDTSMVDTGAVEGELMTQTPQMTQFADPQFWINNGLKPSEALSYAKFYAEQAQGSGGGTPLNRAQRSLVATSNRSLQDLRRLLNRDSSTLQKAAALPVFLQDTDTQSVNRLRRDIEETIGRLNSGGAITDDEKVTFASFVPQVGDTAETINYKLNSLQARFDELLR